MPEESKIIKVKKFCKKGKTFNKTYLLIALVVLFLGFLIAKDARAIPSSPTGLSASCPVPGTSATVWWNASPGATSYSLRVDNQQNGWSGTCSWTYPGDVCQQISATSYTFSSVPDAPYWWWVHSCDGTGCSAAASASFTCIGLKSCGRCSTQNPCQYATWQVPSNTDCEVGTKYNVVYTPNNSCTALCPSGQCSGGACYSPSPTCSSAGPDGWTTTATAGTQTVYAYGVNNATAVYFPTWSDVNGQDDLIWYPGTNIGGNTWKADINLASHPGIGTINVHVYLYNNYYSNIWCDTANGSRSFFCPSFRSGSVNPSTVNLGGSYTATCDYGQAGIDCVNVTPPSGSCSWAGWSGTAATFSCAAGSTAGTFTGYCKTVTGTGANCCSQNNADGTLTVQAPTVNNASCGGITAPDSVTVGQSFSAAVTMSNAGTKPWTSDSTPHKLGSADPQDNTRWGLGRVSLPWQPVNPNQVVTFSFNATAPTTPGSYSFAWRMVEDGIEWFGGTCTKTIAVSIPLPPPPTGLSASCPLPGTSATLSWSNTGAAYYAVRIDDTTKGTNNDPCGGTTGDSCPWPTTNSYNLTTAIPGDTYRFWVHSCTAINVCNWASSVPAELQFTCSAPTTYHCSRCSYSWDYQWVEFDSTDATCLTVVPSTNSVTRSCNCTCLADRSKGFYQGSDPACQAVCSQYSMCSGYNTLNVFKSGTGSGTVTSGDGKISCGSTCSASYTSGVSVTLTALASSGSTFAGWSGEGCSGTGTCSVSMTQTRNVTAMFNLSLTPPTGLSYSCGSTGNQVTLSWNAAANASYYYAIRVDNTTKGTNDNPCTGTTGDYCNDTVYGTSITVSIIAGDSHRWWVQSRDSAGNWSSTATMGPNFTCALLTYTLTVSKSGTGSGTVTPSTGTLSWGGGNTGTASYTSGTSVTLTASAASGSTFTSSWSGEGCSGTGTCTVTMIQNRNVTATFNIVIVNQAPVAVATISKDGTTYSDSITVTKGVTTPVYLSAAGSSDPNGWTDSTNGVSSGGKCEWNSDLNQGSPTFERTITNPASPSACNISLGNLTFNDTPGTYIYQVLRITDKPGLQSNVDTVSVTVQSPPNNPPSATNLNATQPDYCLVGWASAIFSWTFTDPNGDTQSAYQIQADDNSNFSSPEVDSGKVVSSSNSFATQVGQLSFNKTYYWRLMVWDSKDMASSWISGTSFVTPKHAYPSIDFTWTPQNPTINENAQFTDQSTVSGGAGKSSFFWTFQDGSPPSSTLRNPLVKFLSTGAKSITLKVTDSDGFNCTGQKTLNTFLKLPEWEEIAPF